VITKITDAQATRKYLTDFSTFASAHDARRTARHVADVEGTLVMVDNVAAWLIRYGDELHHRPAPQRRR
jgi:hypothetical protein